MNEANLTGWLCFLHEQWMQGLPAFIPHAARVGLVGKGWIIADPKEDWDGHHETTVTPAGLTVIDLSGAEWGLVTIPEESEA